MSGLKTSGLYVVIPTTGAPIAIRQLMWSARIPRSRVVLANETSDECKRWSDDYNSLLRPGDPFRTLLDLPEGGSYRLVATGDIDQGRSWMTAVAGAHVALARGEAPAAKAADARLMLWGTGGLDLSTAAAASEAKIVAADYHLTTKIDTSRAMFAEAAHAETPVLCLLPEGEEAERAAGVLAKVLGKQPHLILVVGSLADIAAPIERFLVSGKLEAPAKPAAAESAKAAGSALVVAPKPDVKPDAAPSPPPPPPVGETGASAAAPDAPRPAASTRAPAGASATPAAYAARSRLPMIAAAIVVLLGGAAAAGYMLTRPAPPTPAAAATDAVAPAGTDQPKTEQPRTAAVEPTTPVTPVIPVTPVVPVTPGAPPPPATGPAKPSIARLTLLSAPAGTTCSDLIYAINPEFARSVVEAPEGASAVDVDGANLCGIELAPVGGSRASFRKGTGPRVVASMSSASRLVFNPVDMRGGQTALPTIAIDGPAPAAIEIRRR